MTRPARQLTQTHDISAKVAQVLQTRAGGCRDGSAQFCDRLTAAPGTAAAR